MATITFADVAHESAIFSQEDRAEALVLQLIDTPWFQRLRDISQTANTRLVYMFSEHSRFGHCVGVAYLANTIMQKLCSEWRDEIEPYRDAVLAAAVLHDIGHLAPGSHTAYRTWFGGCADQHEQLAQKIIRRDPIIGKILDSVRAGLREEVCNILDESPAIPPWTWEIISGGGWNVDRGNWCIVDSIMAGVSYGKYNIPALTDSIVLTRDKHLALNENRLDAMVHFSISRHAMYRQLYQHRVLLAADTLNRAVVHRARDLAGALSFADETMQRVLRASSPLELRLEDISAMREHWWRYHLAQWRADRDPILADLSDRLYHRRLFKTVRVRGNDNLDEFVAQAREAVQACGFDPRYYLHHISTSDLLSSDYRHSMLVQMDDGSLRQLSEAEPLLSSLMGEAGVSKRVWLALPEQAKRLLGRAR